jgi:hypothetical protein
VAPKHAYRAISRERDTVRYRAAAPPATSTSTKPGPGTDGAAQAPAMAPWPFPVGTYDGSVQDYDVSNAQTTTAQLFTLWNISPTGWMRGVWVDFLMTITTNATNSVSYSKDNPWTGVQKVTLYDLGGEVVIQLTGYQWMVMNKHGGYFATGDPRADVNYSAVTGTGGTGGSFHYVLYLPLEVVARDSLGVVQNESKPGWKVELYIDSQANTYNQVPSVQGTLRVRGYIDAYTEPASAGGGRSFAQSPPLPGTLQYWKAENNTIPAGTFKYDLTNGIGFPIRNLFYLFYDTSAGTRAAGDGDIPDPFQLLLGNVQLFNRSLSTYFARMGRDFGFFGAAGSSTAADSAMQRENGVLPFYRTMDMTNEPGAELRFRYWDTQVNTLLRLTGSAGGAATLFALVNWIATPSKNRYALIAGG